MKPDDCIGLRELLITRVEELDPDRTATLALSGGTDSTAILFAMLATGRAPRCYTFYCEGTESDDLKSARNLCWHFGLDLAEVEIPWDLERLVEDIRTLLPHCEVLKKTVIQCMHPWLYIYPKMVENGDTLMLNGLGGDDHFCTQRKINVLLNTEGEKAVLDKGWRKCFSSDLNFSAANIIRYGKQFGIANHDVYDDERIGAWFRQFPIRELHRDVNGEAFEKAAAVYAFADYYAKGSFYRAHVSYQKNSALDVLHDQLLHSPYNTRGLRQVIGVYRDISDGKV
ncbi:MAG: hypothetical protein LPL29_14495 [Alphaproteobacteria bacterium]|nr:hypothetical protein [Alphaproteobacteria bacterium]